MKWSSNKCLFSLSEGRLFLGGKEGIRLVQPGHRKGRKPLCQWEAPLSQGPSNANPPLDPPSLLPSFLHFLCCPPPSQLAMSEGILAIPPIKNLDCDCIERNQTLNPKKTRLKKLIQLGAYFNLLQLFILFIQISSQG